MPPRVSPRTDEQWMSGLRAAPPDCDAVAELRETLRRGLARALSSRGGVGEEDLEDFAQEAVIRVLDRLDSFRGDSRFTTWAMAVAVRVAFTKLRRRRWGDRSLEDLGFAPDAASSAARRAGGDPSRAHDRRDVLVALRAAIDRELTPRQRAAVIGELAGVPTDVLAEQLATNPNALYKLHHDARKRLKAALEHAGFSQADVRNAAGEASE